MQQAQLEWVDHCTGASGCICSALPVVAMAPAGFKPAGLDLARGKEQPGRSHQAQTLPDEVMDLAERGKGLSWTNRMLQEVLIILRGSAAHSRVF